MNPFTDREGHDALYAAKDLGEIPRGADAYCRWYERTRLHPVHLGGPERGRVRRLAIEALIDHHKPGRHYLEAGCGVGFLSLYLAARGIRVTGVDISPVAIERARALAKQIGIEGATFEAENLAAMTAEDNTYDGVIAHAALHHFVKYPGVPEELSRVVKPDGHLWFSDGFAENRAYRIFHDKKKMERLGDVLLTKQLIERTFGPLFDVDLKPADWFLMLSKFQMRLASTRLLEKLARHQARVHLALDRRIPENRATLALAGSVLVTMTPRA